MSSKTKNEFSLSYPRKTRAARAGSNLRKKPSTPYESKELVQFRRMSERLEREYRRQYKKLFTRKDAQLAARIVTEQQQAWREAALKAGPDSRKLDALRASAQKNLRRQLTRALPGYRKALALRRDHLREDEKLTKATLGAAARVPRRIALGDITPFGQQVFTPPFSLFDVETVDYFGYVKSNESFASRDIGHLVNNITYDHDDSTSILNGIFGILRLAHAINRASCGINFTMPRAGRLELSAVFRNVYNRITYSVHDNFGFSSAKVSVSVKLFFALVQGTRIIHLPTVVLSSGLISHGSGLSYTLSELDDSTPYTISAVTSESFAANESLQILAGSEFLIASKLDDMHCKASALLWWELKKLAVGVADQPVLENPR